MNERMERKTWKQLFREAPVGMTMLVGAMLWAVVEFIVSVLYFF